jgi:cytochrome c oxidase subunit 2
MKKDAIPGFVNEIWFRADQVGIYRGQCAELCGRDHAFMPVVVDVRSQENFDSWLKAQQGATKTANAAGTTPATAE